MNVEETLVEILLQINEILLILLGGKDEKVLEAIVLSLVTEHIQQRMCGFPSSVVIHVRYLGDQGSKAYSFKVRSC